MTLAETSYQIFGHGGQADRVRAEEVDLVLHGLVHDGRFGAAVQFAERWKRHFLMMYYLAAYEALLAQLKKSAKDALQKREDLTEEEYDAILARVAEKMKMKRDKIPS